MYRVVLYLLIFLVLLAISLSFLNVLSYDPLLMIFNSLIILVSCWAANFVFSKIVKADTNNESVFITSLILILLLPIQFQTPFYVFIFASVLAQGSKYVFAYKKRHIFNPAAFGAFATGLVFADATAIWWVGDRILLIPVALISFLVIRKTRRVTLALTFLGAYLTAFTLLELFLTSSVSLSINALVANVTASGLIFFAGIMVTEPLTSPSVRKLQIPYALLIAILYASSLLQVTGGFFTAEASLLLANVFAFVIGPKYRFLLPLVRVTKETSDIYTFEFKKPKKFSFYPGQYMEWTLSHTHADTRGNRRYLSLASSPTENSILISIRKYNPSSSFKTALTGMAKNDKIVAASLSGDFTLPKDTSTPLVFIAGGIGITPFRSMLQYIVDKGIRVNIILLYVIKKKEDFVFSETFKKAEKLGARTIEVISDYNAPISSKIEKGRLSEAIIKRHVPDYTKRLYYLSGPQIMVQNMESMLRGMGVKKVKTDFFPGY